jgi:hypothetical protein
MGAGREDLHGAMKAAGNGITPVSYSISRLARSTRDMLELAFCRPGDRLTERTSLRLASSICCHLDAP